MAQFLFIEDFSNRGETHRAGAVVDDSTHDLTLLRLQGAALIDYVPEVHDPLVRQYQVQRRRAPGLQLFPILASAGVAGVVSSVTTAPLDLYISDINGSDSNDGLSPGAALKTFEPIDVRVPSEIRHLTKIHVGRHGGAGYAFPALFRERLLGQRLYFVGDGAGQLGEDGFTQLFPGSGFATALAGSGSNAVVTTGLVANDLRRKTIIMETGAAAKDRRSIRNNTTTDIVPARPFSVAVAPGDAFRVVESAVKIDSAAEPVSTFYSSADTQIGGVFTAGNQPMPRVAFVNLSFAGFGALQTIGATVFYGVDFDLGTLSIPLLMGTLYAGMDSSGLGVSRTALAASLDFPSDAPSETSWAGWGLTGVGGFRLLVRGVPLTGYFVVPGIDGGGEPQTLILGGALYNGISNTLGALNVAQGQIEVGTVIASHLPVEILNLGNGPAVLATDNGDVILENCDAVASTGDGVVAKSRGRVTCRSGSVTGGRYALNAQFGGRVEFDAGVALAGTTQDTSVNDGSVTQPDTFYAAVGAAIVDTPVNDGTIVQRIA